MWQQTRDTPQPDTTTTKRVRRTPLRRPTPSPQATARPKPAIEYSIPTSILVPEEDEKLHAKPWKAFPSGSSGGQNINWPALHTRWMNAVVQATPELFPPGTRVQSVRVGSETEPAQVNFNAAFAKPDFWNGELRTQMAIYSVVNTLSSATPGQGRAVPVQILVEGKRIQTLGEFDASDPIEPDFSLNADNSNTGNSNSADGISNTAITSNAAGRANP